MTEDQKVKNFVKEHFYETHLRCGNLEAVSGKFSTEEEAHKLADLCRGKTCRYHKGRESETKTVPIPRSCLISLPLQEEMQTESFVIPHRIRWMLPRACTMQAGCSSQNRQSVSDE